MQKTSEVSMVVTNMTSAVTSTPARKSRIKPPLEMKNSSGQNNELKVGLDVAEPGNSVYLDLLEERAAHKPVEEKNIKKITASKVVEILQQEDEKNEISQTTLQGRLDDIIPDSQPVMKQKPLLPGLLDNIHKNGKCFPKKRCWVSDSPASSCSTVERQTTCTKYIFQQGNPIWLLNYVVGISHSHLVFLTFIYDMEGGIESLSYTAQKRAFSLCRPCCLNELVPLICSWSTFLQTFPIQVPVQLSFKGRSCTQIYHFLWQLVPHIHHPL
ncbi:uncharacterized protein LOC129707382 [Leucoraja erinacea]|uniref:uncharacterized protein LOC129707382 n=1 Tax=Leucoraja erinaceus TaxID=7782 RepID=UPI002458AA03|nr:uncharacterized protein LOC129707382 [Leucoraja erinacea]